MVTQDKISDYLFRGTVEELDPEIADLIRHETARQARYLILIPSESTIPYAVREVLGSAFHNIYAEGYPLEATRLLSEEALLDYNTRLPEYRRIADERYYKGTEYANIAESVARRRVANTFAANGLSANQLYVNVQALSGGPANNAVYTALLQPGDTVMGMDLIEGGHLSHGSPVNRSGKYYNIVSYGVDPDTGKIAYDAMMRLAQEHQPRMIIGGFSSYPYTIDWHKYREIADSVGAYLLADIAHVAGLVAGGVYPSPVGIADVITFTSHKSLNGPRGAVIITHRKDLSSKLDRAVFPGEQGGPHVNSITALAVAMKLAQTDQFRALQQQVVTNATYLAQKLEGRGLHIPYGGTNTHLFTVDCKTIVGTDSTTLTGDRAARLLDLAGVVVNRQTIPGDTSALRPSGIRIGLPWVTQRGFAEAEVDMLGDIIADILLNAVPFSYAGNRRLLPFAKIDFDLLQDARIRVRDLANRVGIDTEVDAEWYPHFHYRIREADNLAWQALLIRGANAMEFLHTALTSDVRGLQPGQSQSTRILNPNGEELSHGILEQPAVGQYRLTLNHNSSTVAAWLRSLSDSFVIIHTEDPYARLVGPVDVQNISPDESSAVDEDWNDDAKGYAEKAFFIGLDGASYNGPRHKDLPAFEWQKPENDKLLTTSLYDLHKSLGAKTVPFAGYDMPVWYLSVTEEHLAVRNSAGIFDVTHMGMFDFRGPGAAKFLDIVTTNDVIGLPIGKSHYTYLLDTNGIPHDDLMIYRLAEEHFLAVVNASNNDKNWAWLKAIKDHSVMIDTDHPSRRVEGVGNFTMRDLRDRSTKDDMRVDVALQGPKSTDILLALDSLEEDKQIVKNLPWAGITRLTLGGFDLIVSRTGYTGERVAYELFVHPDKAPDLFKQLIDNGAVPCGLAARDSLRTEAGLPLYGQELVGPLLLNPADAGFAHYVKLWKPFFIGKAPYIAHEMKRDAKIVRFRLENKRARPPHQGDPIVDSKGRVVGIVTSCSIDSEGFQLGQAYIETAFARKDTQLGVFSGSHRSKPIDLQSAKLGSKIATPEPIVVLSRFPARR